MTKLIVEDIPQKIKFGSLPLGVVFKRAGHLYIKTKEEEGLNVLDLSFNRLTWFGNDVEVEAVASSLTVKF